MLNENTDAGRDFSRISQEWLKANAPKTEVVADEFVARGVPDLTPQLAKFKRLGVGAIVGEVYGTAAPVLFRQWNELRVPSLIAHMGTSAAADSFVAEHGAEMEGSLVNVRWIPGKYTDLSEPMVEAYKKKTGFSPSTFAVQAHDAAVVTLEAIRAAGRRIRPRWRPPWRPASSSAPGASASSHRLPKAIACRSTRSSCRSRTARRPWSIRRPSPPSRAASTGQSRPGAGRRSRRSPEAGPWSPGIRLRRGPHRGWSCDLTKRFGGLLAVNGCSFEVEAGTVVGLIGPNGSGKSTVFNLITNLLHADSGSVLHDGAPIGGLKLHDVARRGIGRTFQEVKIFRELTVWENLGLAALGRGLTGWQDRAHGLLADFKFSHLEQEIGENLSIGQQRLLELSMQLLVQPELLLLDEPLAASIPSCATRSPASSAASAAPDAPSC
jgi:ABC-type branched-subunit amino acid transport system ATPase component